MTVEPSGWDRILEQRPEHSVWYRDRWRAMQQAGDDIYGEARFVDAMVPRGARILDAGCGTGRVGSWLAGAGHTVVGVDGDAVLIEAAKEDFPGSTWIVEDLAKLNLPTHGVNDSFDVIVCAGNVMTFLAPSTRQLVLQNLSAHLAPGGRAVIGFGAGRGYEFDEFLSHAEKAGLHRSLLLSTWDLQPFEAGSNFIVAVLRKG